MKIKIGKILSWQMQRTHCNQLMSLLVAEKMDIFTIIMVSNDVCGKNIGFGFLKTMYT